MMTKEVFLRNKNKDRFISKLKIELAAAGCKILCADSDADTLISRPIIIIEQKKIKTPVLLEAIPVC